VREVAARELDLARAWLGQLERRQDPVVERPVVGELERAERVGDALDRVRQAVREVVHRVDRPLAARAMVRGVHDPVEDRIAQRQHGRGHVDLRAQHVAARRELARAHALEQREALGRRAVAEGARATGFGERAAVRLDLLRGQLADEGLVALDELAGVLVELREVVGGVVEVSPNRPSQRMSASIASTYSVSSAAGFVSSKRR
jgi:hypothetical protein